MWKWFGLALFIVQISAVQRFYYIAADELVWDYAPLNKDGATGVPFNDTNVNMTHGLESPAMWVISSSQRIGKKYQKVLYREYTDSTFTVLKQRSSEWTHLGYLGPVIRGEVGDTLKIVFKNNGRNSYSIHPHGVLYNKENEGVPDHGMSMNSSSSMNGNSVMPGMVWTYTWEVPERAGPGPNDPSSLVWLYHSHVDEVRDVNSGLAGPIIIARRGTLDENGKPQDVEREFVLMFTIIDENLSWFLEDNMMNYLINMTGTMEDLMMDENFIMSNQKHTVNGFLYSNLEGLSMMENETVRWYILALGNEVDIHGVHWHGQTLLYQGQRVDVIELIPASMKTLDMVPDNPGQWLLHCHTNHHITAGMISMFHVMPCPTSCPRDSDSVYSTGITLVINGILFFLCSLLVIVQADYFQ